MPKHLRQQFPGSKDIIVEALILKPGGRLEEAFELLKKKEALWLELGNKDGLAHCYWRWGLFAREQRDRTTEREKLAAALDIFTELNMPRERGTVRAELEKTAAADRAWQKQMSRIALIEAQNTGREHRHGPQYA